MFDRCRVADICGRSLTCKYWISINNLRTFRIANWEARSRGCRGEEMCKAEELKGCKAWRGCTVQGT